MSGSQDSRQRVSQRWSRARRRLLIAAGVFVAIVLLYLGICAYIVQVILTPQRKVEPKPPERFAAEAVHFCSEVDCIPLAGWLLPSSGDRAIVLLHGVHSHCWDGGQPDIAQAYVEAGFHVLVFDLRGHGRSDGNRLALGWTEQGDVRAAVNLLLDRGFEPRKIGLHGTSYGAATALLSAPDIPEVGAVVADSAWASAREVVGGEIQRRTGLPGLFTPGVALTARIVYALDLGAIAPERAVAQIEAPILFIHGQHDSVIPVEHSRRLKKAALGSTAAELWIIPGGHTEGVRKGPEMRELSPMRDQFLRKVCEFFDHWLR